MREQIFGDVALITGGTNANREIFDSPAPGAEPLVESADCSERACVDRNRERCQARCQVRFAAHRRAALSRRMNETL